MITLMARETAEAPAAVARLLAANGQVLADLSAHLRTHPPHVMITCGRGSSDHAAVFAKYAVESRLGILVASHAPSASSLFGSRFSGLGGALFIAISQSGRSPDLIASLEYARGAGATTVLMVNDTTSPAVSLADWVIPLHAGPERAVAATKSCLASMAAIAALVSAWTDDEVLGGALDLLPERLAQALSCDWSSALPVLEHATSLFTIGRGLTFGVALEAALKLKETCGLHAEGFSAAEVRHGPMALVKAGFPVLMFPPDDPTRESFPDLADLFAGRGAPVLVAGSGAQGDGIRQLAVPAPLHPLLDPPVQLAAFYKLAETLSRQRGLDPDSPPHLAKVTRTL
jgi:glutamine---fructose-6-phosphate transaminase (isomerizing)